MLINYLAGEGQSEALYLNLFALSNPSARLPETWISSLSINPYNLEVSRRDDYFTYYDDDIFVGYRYYDKTPAGFILPFGYGLSYSNFIYDNLTLSQDEKHIYVKGSITNTSNIDGEDVLQIYVGKKDSSIYRPIKEFKAFEKVFVKANETKEFEVKVEIDNLKSYRDATDLLEIETGNYQIYLGKNAKEIKEVGEVYLNGVTFEEIKEPKPLPRKKIANVVTMDTPAGVLFYNDVFKNFVKEHNLAFDLENFEEKYWAIDSSTLRNLTYHYDISFEQLEELIKELNKHNNHLDKVVSYDHFIADKLFEIKK